MYIKFQYLTTNIMPAAKLHTGKSKTMSLRKNVIFAVMKIEVVLPACKSIVIRQLVIHFIATGEILPVEDGDPRDVRAFYRRLCGSGWQAG